jgi:ABC-2 type transport system ATP-binding protein
MEQVEEICDHIVLVNRGQKILDGTVRDVKQQFKQNLFHIGFNAQPITTPATAFRITEEGSDHALTVKIEEGYTPNDVLQHFLQQGAPIHSFNELLPSLNDIFIQLVEGTPTSRKFQNIPA